MKNLHFEIEEKEHYCSIHLVNCEWLKFKNKTKAKKFVRKYKKVILDNVRILNSIQPQINQLYRQNILQLEEGIKRSVRQSLLAFDDRFEYIFKIFSPGNNNDFVLGNIEKSFDHLESAAFILFSFAKKYKNYSLKASTRPILKNLELLYKQYKKDRKSLKVDMAYVDDKEIPTLKIQVG